MQRQARAVRRHRHAAIRPSRRVIALRRRRRQRRTPARMFVNAEAARASASVQRRPGHRAPARRSSRRCPGATLYPAGRPGPAHRRPRQQRAVSVHAAAATTSRELNEWAPQVLQRSCARCRSSPTSTAISRTRACRRRSRSTATRPSRLGITPQTIDDTLYDAFGQRQVSTMYTPLNQYHVVMEVEPRVLAEPRRRCRHIYVRVRRPASSVPLSAFTHYAPAHDAARRQPPGPVPVGDDLLQPAARRGARRRRRRRSSSAEREMRPARRPSTAASRARRRPSRPRWRTSRILIAAALLAVYIVLGILYESYIHPITILSTLPSAGVGALLALLLCQHRPERDRADRHHPADRHREEERDHDDRLRARGRAQARARRPRRRSSRPACCASGRSR